MGILAAWQQSMTFPDPSSFWQLLLAATIWAILGLIVLIAGYKTFDWVLRRVDVDAELNKGNIAVAIVVAALLLAIAIIIHAAVA